MRVFVTGATGFLGQRVVDRLLKEGHLVRVLVRTPSRYSPPEGVEVVPGGLEDIADWADSLSGCAAVVHLAGIIDVWGDPKTFDRVVVQATQRLVEAADRRGVSRFVYISSESVMQAGKPLLDVDESYPLPAQASSAYGQAKQAAERLVLDYPGPIHRVVLRPTFIWGRGCQPLADMATRARFGKLPLFDGGRSMFEHVHVDNVALAVDLALTNGVNRGIYLITNGEPMPVRDFLAGVLPRFGASVPTRSLPSKLVYAIAGALERPWRALTWPGKPPVTRFEVEFLSLPRRYRIDRAVAELGYQPEVGFAKGVEEL